jgi:hypothetical protein
MAKRYEIQRACRCKQSSILQHTYFVIVIHAPCIFYCLLLQPTNIQSISWKYISQQRIRLDFSTFSCHHQAVYICAPLNYTSFQNCSSWKYNFIKLTMFHIKSRQTSTITTSTKELYMQPHTHNDCTRDCNVERIYFIVKRQNILTF